MVDPVASWLPGRKLVVLADRASVGKALRKGLPQNVAAIGPIHECPKATRGDARRATD